MKNLQQFRLWIVGSLLLPFHALCFSGTRMPVVSRNSPNQNVGFRSNLVLSRSNLPNGVSRLTSQPYRRPSAVAAASLPPVGLVSHVGIMSIAILVVKGLKRTFFVSNEDEPPVGVMERCPWPFIFFHDPKQGLKDMPTWITVLYIVLWRCVKVYQRFKPSG